VLHDFQVMHECTTDDDLSTIIIGQLNQFAVKNRVTSALRPSFPLGPINDRSIPNRSARRLYVVYSLPHIARELPCFVRKVRQTCASNGRVSDV
jgi:hypothetical protein